MLHGGKEMTRVYCPQDCESIGGYYEYGYPFLECQRDDELPADVDNYEDDPSLPLCPLYQPDREAKHEAEQEAFREGGSNY